MHISNNEILNTVIAWLSFILNITFFAVFIYDFLKKNKEKNYMFYIILTICILCLLMSGYSIVINIISFVIYRSSYNITVLSLLWTATISMVLLTINFVLNYKFLERAKNE